MNFNTSKRASNHTLTTLHEEKNVYSKTIFNFDGHYNYSYDTFIMITTKRQIILKTYTSLT